jgi:glycosyltransferase involved in cell wall biosynthesis
MRKLAIITSHPIQYYAPWFRYLAQENWLDIRVFYLWDFGITEQTDSGFQRSIQWDIPLLTGYEYKFVPNRSSQPGTNHFWGLQNPSLRQQVENYKPDAVLMMNYNYASLYQFIFTWRRTPLLFRGDSHHLVPGTGWREQLRRSWISLIYSRFAACLYVGQANYGYFRDHGVPEQRLFFSPHAIDNHRFFTQTETAIHQAEQWKQELGIPADHKIILFTGKLIEKKRPLDLLESFIQAKLPQTALLFVGSGELEASLRQKAANHPHVYFAPFQNQSLMPRTYSVADLVVLPSYGSGETWGLAVNEAMCLSKPVVVSDHVGCAADLVQPNVNGLVFPAGDISALAQCLETALMDLQRLQQWGKASQQIIQRYSYSQTTTGLKAALDAVSYHHQNVYGHQI